MTPLTCGAWRWRRRRQSTAVISRDGGGKGGGCLMAKSFSFASLKNFRDLVHSKVSALDTTELYI